jgi:hypothetical protein
MTTTLVPCDHCQRHFRRAETRCPFCGLSVTANSAAALPEPTERLSRVGILAFVATMGAASCSSMQTLYGGPPAPARPIEAVDTTDAGTPPAPDAGTPAPDAGTPDAGTPVRPPGSMMLRYGAPPRP